ncbi:MAG: hypothetical protein LBL21_01090 [Rickettsiales bacterium]|jgi:hypothetical protein|nr:hypothetical protein [Rickettsiales bacterium]
MANEVEVKNKFNTPLQVEMVKDTFEYTTSGVRFGVDIAMKIGIIAGIFKVADAIGQLAPYLKQIAENGGR